MSSTANIFTLVTIIFGLMLTDLFASLHRLIRNRRRVRWHWLPLLVSWYVLTMVLKNWWGLVFSGGDNVWASGWIFFFYGHLLLLLYLLASAVLPDEVPADGLDLREFYIENRRHFWGLMASVYLLMLIFTLVQPIFTDSALSWMAVLPNIVMGAAALSLTWVRRIGYHAVVVLLKIWLIALEMIGKF
jgi:hypothetical protein